MAMTMTMERYRYVQNPQLWNGKKFHYRCYSMVMADLSVYLYSNAFILTAGLDYNVCQDGPTPDVNRHITNLSVNKRFAGHPGQIPVNLAHEVRLITSPRIMI